MKTRALDSWQYGDPAKVAERKEAASCKGCKHDLWANFGGPDVRYCDKGIKTHPMRCASNYKERN